MSSLAAARADNFYYPPNFDPQKHKTLAKFTGQHPLRERAKKLDQGILVIRFEVPYNIWCEKCGEMIATGVRFNAEKQAVGNYHSTKIWSFSMRHHCGCKICIQTDPKNAEYIITEGARRKVEEYTAAQAEVIDLPDEKEKQARQDPFYRLEHATAAKATAMVNKSRLEELKDLADDRNADPITLNRALRGELRAKKRSEAALDVQRKSLGLHESVKLLPESQEDADKTMLAFYNNDNKYQRNWAHKRTHILAESIFTAKPAARPGPVGHKPAGGGAAAAGAPVAGLQGILRQPLPGGGAGKTGIAEKAQRLAKRVRL